MKLISSATKYGDNVSTDQIFPGRYTYLTLTEDQMGEHALEDLDAGFSGRDVRGGTIVAGINWGCGSAREQAVKCLKNKGIKAVIAKSIARIYYRNCINEGLLPIICPEAAEAIQNGDEITIDTENSVIQRGADMFKFSSFPDYVMEIIECGGLIEKVRREVAEKKHTEEGI